MRRKNKVQFEVGTTTKNLEVRGIKLSSVEFTVGVEDLKL